MAARRWRVDVYYSSFTTVEVEADSEDEAILSGRREAGKLLGRGFVLDQEGALSQLVELLEPWEECDMAEEIIGTS